MNEVWRGEVLVALSNACSQNPGLIKEAESQLKMWETQAGFYSLLMVRTSLFLVSAKSFCDTMIH